MNNNKFNNQNKATSNPSLIYHLHSTEYKRRSDDQGPLPRNEGGGQKDKKEHWQDGGSNPGSQREVDSLRCT